MANKKKKKSKTALPLVDTDVNQLRCPYRLQSIYIRVYLSPAHRMIHRMCKTSHYLYHKIFLSPDKLLLLNFMAGTILRKLLLTERSDVC